MTPFVSGSTALRMESPMGYDPVSFKRMRLAPHSCQVRVQQDGKGNALFEVFCGDAIVMAFLYENLRPWELNQRRDAFSRLFRTKDLEDKLLYFSVCPTQTVCDLPKYPMWEIHSPLRESGFWACDELRMSVSSDAPKNVIVSLAHRNGTEVAYFQITGLECDDEEVLDAAFKLRQTLHMAPPIRIVSEWEQQKIVWFYPATNTIA